MKLLSFPVPELKTVLLLSKLKILGLYRYAPRTGFQLKLGVVSVTALMRALICFVVSTSPGGKKGPVGEYVAMFPFALKVNVAPSHSIEAVIFCPGVIPAQKIGGFERIPFDGLMLAPVFLPHRIVNPAPFYTDISGDVSNSIICENSL